MLESQRGPQRFGRLALFRRAVVLAFLAIGTVQCGKKDQKIDIEILPATPPVFDSALTINAGSDNETTIERAWTKFKVRMTNRSTSVITVASLRLEVTGKGKDGSDKEGSVDFDPVEVGGNSTQTYWLTLQPNETQIVNIGGTDITFYAGGLPNGDDVANLRFRAELFASGWIGGPDDPEKSVKSSHRFTTLD